LAEQSTTRFEANHSAIDIVIKRSLRASASLVAVGCLLASATAYAQETSDDDDDDDDNAIVVTGIRQSLANSQNIKRNSDTVVDAITAEDIGALPDRSITEALQRVPGVAINRFAGSNDPDHFSVEGSGVVIRGLNFVRGEFNGRDAFSANGGRALGFSDVPPELMGSVIVAKNVTAEMIEGGLAGTVNLNVRKPFDDYGLHFGFTAEANYSDFVEELTPNVSGMISNTWETDSGTFGLLFGMSYSQVKSRSDGIQITNFQTRDGETTQGSNGSGETTRTQLPGKALAYAPLGGQFRVQEYDRERMGIAAAAQWESNDQRAKATLEFFRAETSNAWGEHTFESGPDLSEYNTFPASGTDYTYDSNNVFESGHIVLPGTGWRSGDSNQPWVPGDPNSPGARATSGGMQMSLANRQVYQETVNQDIGFNFQFAPDDRWQFNFDAQYTEASTDNLDVSIFGSTFADQYLDLSGDLPVVVNHRPQNTKATWAGPTAMDGLSNDEYFGSRSFTFWRAAMDHIEQSDGAEYAFKGDVAYNFDEGSFLKRIKVGGRFSDRDQTVRNTTYNWGRLSEVWAGNSGGAVFFDEFGTEQTEWYGFDNFYRGATPGPMGAYYYSGDLIGDYDGSSDFFDSVENYFRFGQNGPANGQGLGWRRLSDRPGVISGTPFLPSDIQIVSEETFAGYIMASFGNDEYADYPNISGNVGVRFVSTTLDSAGSIAFPPTSVHGDGQSYGEYCAVEIIDPDGDGPLPPMPADLPAICDIGEAGFNSAAAFSNGGATPQVANFQYENWLPSLNLKLELNPEMQIRFAASRTMARPDFRYSRNYVTIGTDSANGFRFQASAGNPYLKPAKSDQFDLSFEWYFDDVGSITLTGFYKSVKDFFYDSVEPREFTNGGVTQNVFIRGPQNYSLDDGEIKGFELAYQQTYDFLPAPFDGLGFSGNYTYIESKGIPNSLIGGIENPGQAVTVNSTGNLPLEQLSKHNVNATLFYEKGPLSMRASYNWRSRFLLTARDVIFPYFPVYNDDTGQVDASIFYSVTDNVKLSIQGTNLFNEVTTTLQQFTTDGLLGPRSYFVNDRRFSFGVRASW
jgi:TonB-dependent receptor